MIPTHLVRQIDRLLAADSEPPLRVEEQSRLANMGLWARMANADVLHSREIREASAHEGTATVKAWRSQAAGPVQIVQPRNVERPEPDTRRAALSHLVALEASKDEGVIAFRREYLARGLLKWSEVDRWIQSALKREGPPTRYLQLPIPQGTEVHLDHDSGHFVFDPPLPLLPETSEPLTIHVGHLAYALPESTAPITVPVARGGALDQLRLLNERLSDTYRWGKAEATVFVLTGLEPMVSTTKTEIEYRYPLTAASRIVLTLDPMLTDRQVAAIYRNAKVRFLGRRRRAFSSDKPLRLAVFVADQRTAEPELTWEQLRIRWNKLYPDDFYKDRRPFERDASDARERLLTPDIEPGDFWPTEMGEGGHNEHP